MRKKQIVRNASATVVQVVVTGILLFVLYRFLLETIGIEQLGVWSVVLATTSISRISELGLTGSVVKFVAKYVGQNDNSKAGDIIQTAVLSLGVFVGLILCLAYFPLHWILAKILPLHALPTATEILPYALVSLWVATLSGVFQSGLDGCLRTDLRALFNIINSFLTLVLAVILVPEFGLLGLAYAQLSLAGLLLMLSWVYLRLELKSLPYIPYRWNIMSFREIIRYGVNFQVISIFTMSFDPVTKALLSKYGGLASVGYYEMASRMIIKFRSLITAPNQVLVPVVAGLQETEFDQVLNIYKISYRLQVFLSLPLYAGILSIIPVVSVLWIGAYEWTFVLYSLLLTLGWCVNGFINPAYFSNLGIGNLKWNMTSTVIMGTLNVILGVILGLMFGGTGVVIAWVISLIIGSSVVILAFHYENRLPLHEIFPSENIWLTIACAVGVSFAWLAYSLLQMDLASVWMALVCPLVFIAVISIPGWRHPMRARLYRMIAGRYV